MKPIENEIHHCRAGVWPWLLIVVSLLCVQTRAVSGQEAVSHPVQTVTKTRPRVGIVLEGGGALGMAHIGVLKWLQENHVPVDSVAGTSMGALIGSLAATGRSPQDIEHLVLDTRFDDLFTFKPSLSRVSFRRRQDREDMPQAVTVGLRGGTLSLGNSLIADERLNAFLTRQLVSYNSEALRFDDLPIPFRCVATDLTTLRPMVISAGSLSFAVRASISIPGVFPPVQKDGDFLVDGAIMDNLPTDVAVHELKDDVVISVYLGDDPLQAKDAGSMVGIFERALQAGTSRNVEASRSLATIEIQPQLGKLTAVDYQKGAILIRLGYEAAERQRSNLLRYALDDKSWRAYLAEIQARRKSVPGLIRSVRAEGPSAKISGQLARSLGKLQNRPFDASKTEDTVSNVRGEGILDAYYETFPTPAAESAAVKGQEPVDDGVVLHWQRKPEGPPYILLGTDAVAMTSNVTKSVFDLRFVDPNLTGYGSEWRSTLQIGYLTRASTEYYQPLGGGGLFVQPRLLLRREPVYLWQNQKRISERFLQQAGGGIDAGLTGNHNLQAAAEYRASTIHWSLRSGTDHSPTPYLSGSTQTAALHLIYSDRTAEVASPKGTQVDLTTGYLFRSSASASAPFLKLGVKHSYTVSERNTLSLSAEADTFFRANVADPLRPTLGGPLRLYASSVDEYRGTDTVLGRAIYLRKVASLPTGLGHGVYLTGGVEAGNIWSPEQHSILREDGFGGVLVSTPLGALTLGGAVGDAGHRKIFFTFGKLF